MQDKDKEIIDAQWFVTPHQICDLVGIVLVRTPSGRFQAHIGGVSRQDPEAAPSAEDARFIVEEYPKIPHALATAAFPGKFTEEEYDEFTQYRS